MKHPLLTLTLLLLGEQKKLPVPDTHQEGGFKRPQQHKPTRLRVG